MRSVQEMLSRIRWDKNFGNADFKIGYYDRVEDTLIMVSYVSIDFPPDEHFVFELLDKEGKVHLIPYHRIRQILRNGQCIWKRKVH